MSAPIQVLAIRELDGKSTVKAFVDIRIGGVTIKGAKVVKQDNALPWLAMPSVQTGIHGWQNTVEVSRELRERLTAAVLEVWESRQDGKTQVHRLERPADPRQAHVDELAAAWDRRGPDDIEDVL